MDLSNYTSEIKNMEYTSKGIYSLIFDWKNKNNLSQKKVIEILYRLLKNNIDNEDLTDRICDILERSLGIGHLTAWGTDYKESKLLENQVLNELDRS